MLVISPMLLVNTPNELLTQKALYKPCSSVKACLQVEHWSIGKALVYNLQLPFGRHTESILLRHTLKRHKLHETRLDNQHRQQEAHDC